MRNKLFAVFMILFLTAIFIPNARAASLTSISDTMTRLEKSTVSNHTITFTTPSGVDAGETITVTMPSGFTIGSVDYTDIDVKDDAVELTLGAAPSGTTWGAAFTGQVLTITSGTGTIAGSSVIEIQIGTNADGGDQQIANHATAATYTISIAGTFGDTGSLAIVIVDDDNVTITATVSSTLTFTINDNAVSLGTLSTGSVSTDTTNFDVSTNGTGGYSVTILDDGNLRSGTDDINDVGDGTVTAGSEEYGVSTSKAGQTITATSGNAASALTTSAQSCASAAAPASSDNTVLTFHASISGSTPAGSYQHITTLVATGNF